MKLKRGESRIVYLPKDGSNDLVERNDMLLKVQGKPLSHGKEILEEYEKATETTWCDKLGNPVAKSYSDVVIGISVTPGDAEERQRELLNELKSALEAISREDATIEDVKKALQAQVAYSEFMEWVRD